MSDRDFEIPNGPGGQSRRADLLGLRGLFTLLVVLFHGWQWTHPGLTPDARTGPVAVVAAQLHWAASWFFIVTAFLLARSIFANHLLGRPQQSSGRFMARRILRIAPAYWVVILIVWAARNPHFPVDWRDLVEHLTFTQAFDTKRIFYTDGPTWSLTTEMVFYLVVALLLIPFCRFLGSRGDRVQRVALFVPGIAMVLGGTTFGLVAVRAGIPDGQWATWFGPLAQGPALGAGLLLAACSAVLTDSGRRDISPRAGALVRTAGVVALLSSATVPYSTASGSAGYDFAQRLVATLGLALLVGGTVLAPKDSWWSRALSIRPLAYVGTISFSLYLWHEPVLLILGHFGVLPQRPDELVRTSIVLVAAALLLGTLAYHLIERPCLNLLAPLSTSTSQRYAVLPADSLVASSYRAPRPAGVLAFGGGAVLTEPDVLILQSGRETPSQQSAAGGGHGSGGGGRGGYPVAALALTAIAVVTVVGGYVGGMVLRAAPLAPSGLKTASPAIPSVRPTVPGVPAGLAVPAGPAVPAGLAVPAGPAVPGGPAVPAAPVATTPPLVAATPPAAPALPLLPAAPSPIRLGAGRVPPGPGR